MKQIYLKQIFTILLLLCCTVASIQEVEAADKCGDNAFWTLDETTGTLTISGEGEMYDYQLSRNNAPWYANRSIIEEVVINEGITAVGEYAFYNCTNLTNIIIPNSVTTIKNFTFTYCSKLTSITIPSNATTIGNYAFYKCNSLTSIEIPNSVTAIGSAAFNGCSSLTSIEIPNSITTIETSTFNGCSSLRSIRIPSGVTSIGGAAFNGCSSLESITSQIPSNKLFVPGNNAFYGIDKSNCTLYVPAGAKSTYEAKKGWNEFTNIVEETKEITLVDGEPYTATEAEFYNTATYNRTFNNTNWQAWYVPFDIEYEQLRNDFEVAEIMNIHQGDENDDGEMDVTELEIIKIKTGTLSANYPYLIRKKEKGEYSFVVENTMLEAAADNTIDCSSVKIKYNFTGTSTGIEGYEMYDKGYYALSGGALMQAANSDVYLKPLRWYMSIETRSGVKASKTIKIRVAGETTGVEEITTDNNSTPVYYDLSGRGVENPTCGIYIVNGKKRVIK